MMPAIARRAIARPRQRGIVLLEALIAIAIFGFGVLGLIGLQASSVKESTNAKFRSDASLLADELIGKMWVSDRDSTKLAAAFASPAGLAYKTWLGAADQPGTVLATLPKNADTQPPKVEITPVPGAAGSIPTSSVRVTMYWAAPYDQKPHQYTIVTQIR